MLTDSPEFQAPQLSGPYVRAVSPVTYQLQVLRPAEARQTRELRFEVVSEDLNQRGLQVRVVIDFPGYRVPYPDQLDHRLTPEFEIPPGHINLAREVTTPKFALGAWPLGCHSVTLFVARAFENTLTVTPAGYGDGGTEVPVDTLTWWYLLIPEPGEGEPGDLGDCYARQAAVDAGAGSQSRGSVAP